MLFSERKQFNQCEIQLVNTFLEKLIDQQPDFCREAAEEEDFIFLDHWNNKMGFVKEVDDQYLILSLEFKDSACKNYQLILKNIGQKWSESHVIDYDGVRKAGILE